MRSASMYGRQFWALLLITASSLVSGTALAVVRDPAVASQVNETTVRYATEPSTGSMVLAALVVVAVVRRGRLPIPIRSR